MLVVKAILSGLIGASLYAALLLIPAGLVPDGTWIWPRGIALSVALCLLSVAGTVALARINPASYRVRLQGPLAQRHARQPLADIVITGLLSFSVLLWLILIPLDVFYLRLLPRPSAAISWAGAAAAIVGFLVMSVAIAQNEFAAPNVQLQSEQRVIATGLYGVVRHPLYAGGLIMFSGWALWIESYAALIALAGVLLLVFARIAVEEAFLQELTRLCGLCETRAQPANPVLNLKRRIPCFGRGERLRMATSGDLQPSQTQHGNDGVGP